MKTHKIKLFLNFCDDVLYGDKTFSYLRGYLSWQMENKE